MSETNPRPAGFFGGQENRCFILDVSFECEICGEDTPVREAFRLEGTDLCKACYEDALTDDIPGQIHRS